MRPHVPHEALTLRSIPPADAPWSELVAFGHGFHAYKVAGSLQEVARRTLTLHDAWAAGEPLPRSLPPLRLALFHTVRAVAGQQPDADTEAWARSLVAEIRGCLAEDGARPEG